MAADHEHRFAWELSHDRYKPRLGNLKALIEEIRRSTSDFIISSEKFESSLLYPVRWRRLVAALVEAQVRPIPLTYLLVDEPAFALAGAQGQGARYQLDSHGTRRSPVA